MQSCNEDELDEHERYSHQDNEDIRSVMDEGYGQQLDAYGDQPDCTSTEEQLQCNEEMDIQMEGLNDIENDEGLDDGKQNDDWNEEADTV